MYLKGMYIAGTGVSVPPCRSVAEAVAAGLYDAEEAARTGMVECATAPDGDSTLDYAISAAGAALADAPLTVRESLRVLYHATVSPPGGPPAWAPSAKIHEQLGLPPSVRNIGVSTGCTIGLTAIEEACLRLQGDPAERGGAALLVASEVWPPELAARYTAGRGLMLADGAAAMVLTNRPHRRNFARVLATEVRTASQLVDSTRGANSLAYDHGARIDLGARLDHFIDNVMSIAELREIRDELIHDVVTGVLEYADLRLKDITAYVLTHSGRRNLQSGYFRLLPDAEASTNTLEIGLHTGHLGAADWCHGLHVLRQQGAFNRGDRVLMLGGGGGHVEAAAVLAVL